MTRVQQAILDIAFFFTMDKSTYGNTINGKNTKTTTELKLRQYKWQEYRSQEYKWQIVKKKKKRTIDKSTNDRRVQIDSTNGKIYIKRV